MRNWMLILVAILLCSCSTMNYQSGYYADHSKKPIYSHVLTDKLQMPYRLMISDGYLKTKNSIFILNQDYIRSYTKLVEYDLTTSTITQELASFVGNEKKISEVVNDDDHIVYVVTKSIENKKYKDIYLYDIENKTTTLIKSDILCGIGDSHVNDLYVTINKNYVYWINPDFENKKTEIQEYNMTDHSTVSIYHQSFLDMGSFPNIPIKYLSLSDNCLVFNSRSNEGIIRIIIFDLSTRSIMKEVVLPADFTFNYYSIMDNSREHLYLYCDAGKEDLIFQLNIQSMAMKNLIGFLPRSYLVKDRFYFSDNKLFYSIQQDFTGYIKDHYYSEIYNLDNFQMLRYKYVFNFVKSDHFFAFLRFDEITGPDNINLVIYQIKDNE